MTAPDLPEGAIPALTAELANALVALTAEAAALHTLSVEIRDEKYWRKKAQDDQRLARTLIGVGVLMLLGMVGYLTFNAIQGLQFRRDQNRTLRSLSTVSAEIQAATSPQAQQRNSAAVAAAVAQIGEETDCTVRRDLLTVAHAANPNMVIALGVERDHSGRVICPAMTIP